MTRRPWRRLAALFVALVIAAFVSATSGAFARERPADAGHEILYANLPREAQQTLQAIKRGGPFAYERDGVVFGNYERLLPSRQRGYYHEYTVPTPNVKHRGARRIVAGAEAEYYFSDDHYRSFRRIRE